MQSREGIPLGSDRHCPSQSRDCRPSDGWPSDRRYHTGFRILRLPQYPPRDVSDSSYAAVGKRLKIRTNCFYVDQFRCHASHPGMRKAGSPCDLRSRRCASTADTKMYHFSNDRASLCSLSIYARGPGIAAHPSSPGPIRESVSPGTESRRRAQPVPPRRQRDRRRGLRSSSRPSLRCSG